jgi:limonene-1,2-epoxide hydrolase
MFKLAIKIFAKPGETVLLDCLPHIGHQLKIVMQIMDGIQVITEYFAGLKKMSQVGPAIVSTGVTGAFRIKGFMIVAKPGVLNGNFPF